MKIHAILVIVASSLLYGCATSPRLSEAGFPRTEGDVDILAVQQEIKAEVLVMDGGTAGGGLLGMLMANAMTNKMTDQSESMISPLRDHLIDFELRETFVERIQNSSAIERLVIGAEPVVRHAERSKEERYIDRPLITIEPEVQLSYDMRSMLVELYVSELKPWKNRDSPMEGVSERYQFKWPLDGTSDMNREESLAAWLALPADDVTAIIEMGMDETIAMLETHLEQGALVFEDAETRVRIPGTGRLNVWQSHDGITWFAASSGNSSIYAIPDHGVE